MSSKFKLLLFFLLLLRLPAQAQDSVRCGRWITADVHYGFIIPLYSNAMDILIKAHVPAMEFDYVSKPTGDIPWQHAFHCPETGVAFFYAWLGNPTQLGNAIGVYPFVNLHLHKSFREALYLRVGTGLAYMPVIFNRLNNHKDNVIGSHINAMINLRLNAHFYLSDRLRIEAGFGVTHCSDGNYQDPNLGLNLLTVNTGLSYCLNPSRHYPPHYKDSVSVQNKKENNFYIGLGLSEMEPPGGTKYGAITINYMHYFVINPKVKLGGGVDVFYNQTNVARMAADSIYLKTPLQNIQYGIKAGYELTLGKISLPLEFGVYLYSKFVGSSIYDRIGIRYYANKHLIITQTLLLHFASADYMEWGVGYRL
jgi:hypothetical protein